MEEKVIEILKEVLEYDGVDANTSQDNCENWDSMAQLNLSVELEDNFEISLEPEEISSMKSVQDIVNLIKSKK